MVRACLALLAVVLTAAACSPGQSGSASNAARSARPAASPTIQPSPVPAAPTPVPTPAETPAPAPTVTAASPSSGLALSGAINALAAETRSIGACGTTSGAYAAQLTFTTPGQAYDMTIEIFDYHGAGRYSVPPERISVRAVGATPQPMYPAVSGNVTVDATGRLGSLDVALSVPGGASELRGNWAC